MEYGHGLWTLNSDSDSNLDVDFSDVDFSDVDFWDFRGIWILEIWIWATPTPTRIPT